MVPPEHLNSCDQFDPSSCYVYGPLVLVAKLIARQMCDGRNPIVQDRSVDYSEWYHQFFNNRMESVDFTVLRNTRDAVLQYTHRDRSDQHDLKLFVNYIFEFKSPIRPIQIEDIVLVVPQRRNEFRSDYYVNVMRFVILMVICCLTTLVSTVLFANEHLKRFRKPNECQLIRGHGYAYIVLDTWARSLGNSASSRSNASLVERILFITLAAFAILAGSFISGELMENLVNVIDVDQIDTLLGFLDDSRMMLRVPMFLFTAIDRR